MWNKLEEICCIYLPIVFILVIRAHAVRDADTLFLGSEIGPIVLFNIYLFVKFVRICYEENDILNR